MWLGWLGPAPETPTFAWTFARCGCAEPVHFYVARDGNDAWSGRIATPNATKTDGPIATLAQAGDVVREHRRGNRLPAGAIVIVGEGPTSSRRHLS